MTEKVVYKAKYLIRALVKYLLSIIIYYLFHAVFQLASHVVLAQWNGLFNKMGVKI